MPSLFMPSVAPGYLCLLLIISCRSIWHIFMAMATLAVFQQGVPACKGGVAMETHTCGSPSSASPFPNPSISLPCWLWFGPQDGTLRTGPRLLVAFHRIPVGLNEMRTPRTFSHSFSFSIALTVMFTLS